jgi:hypothetical protein
MLEAMDSNSILWRITFAFCVFYSAILLSGWMGMGGPELNDFSSWLVFVYGMIMILSPFDLLLSKWLVKTSVMRGLVTLTFMVLCIFPVSYFLIIASGSSLPS